MIDRRLDGASEIVLVDAHGRLRATTIHSEANELPPAVDRLCFLVLSRNESASCISQPYANPQAGRYLFSLSQRLEKDGVFDGVAQVAISADYIVGLWTSATPRTSDIVTMFKSDGTVLAQSGVQSPAGPSRPDIGRLIVREIHQDETGIITAPLFGGGADRTTVYSKVANEPVYIALSLDKDAILQTWYSNLTVYGLVAASATAGIILAFGLALRRARSERLAVNSWQAEVEERLKTQEELRQSQKMEALGKLTGGMAHDFNNLLTVIVGNLGMAEEFMPAGKGSQFLRNARNASRSAVQVATRLLAFARKQILEPRAIDLGRLVEGMRPLLLRTLGSNIKLLLTQEPDTWLAMADPNQLELIVLNLAINARDAMPGGGTLTISAMNGHFNADAPHDLAPGEYVVLTVADTGTGMDAATVARATEPFFSTKEVGKGTGLGLSIMQGVVVQSGGAARLRSQPGQGTEVEMWLPRARVLPAGLRIQKPVEQANEEADQADDLAPHEPSGETTPQGPIGDRQMVDPRDDCTGTVLVCDDDLTVLQFVCDALETKGCRAIPAANGEAAISMLENNKSIDLLVVDFTMPEMNGADVIRHVQESRPELPVLLMTGNADPDSP